MAITAHQGPLVIMRSNPLGSVGTESANQNPQTAPSLFHQGFGLLDPRVPFTYFPGGDVSNKVYGFFSTEVDCLNVVASALSATNIATSQSPGAAALTLTAGTGVTGSTTITNAVTGLAVTGVLALDTAMAGVGFGQDLTINIWDPTKALSRNVRITSGGNDSGISFLVVGYDLYGYPMSEAITGANAGVASGVKAFKYITSITPSGAAASTVTAGTGDVFGLPIRSDFFPFTRIFWNNAAITAATGFTAAVTTTATTTTGDIRGTYNVQSASDGTKRLVIFQHQQVANVNVTGTFGVAQNLSSTNGG